MLNLDGDGNDPVCEPLADAVIVDDWALLRLGISAALEPAGIRTVADAASGADGLQCLAETSATLLVLGHHVDATTRDTLERVMVRSDGVAVVALLPPAEWRDAFGLLAAGAASVLPRPVEADELRTAATKALTGERFIATALLAVQTPLHNGPPGPEVVHPLTAKEREVLSVLARGLSNREIATSLWVSEATIKTHLAHVYEKLGAANRRQAVARAIEVGLLV